MENIEKFTELMDSPFIQDNNGIIYVNNIWRNDNDKEWKFYHNKNGYRNLAFEIKKDIDNKEMKDYLDKYNPYKYPSQPSLRSSQPSLRSSHHSLRSSQKYKSETENKSRYRKILELINKYRPLNKERRTKIYQTIKSLLGYKGGFNKTKRNKRSIRKKR